MRLMKRFKWEMIKPLCPEEFRSGVPVLVVALSFTGSRIDRFSLGCRLMPVGRDDVRCRQARKTGVSDRPKSGYFVAASVGVCGLLADGQQFTQRFGGMLGLATVFDVASVGQPPLEGRMLQVAKAHCGRGVSCGGPPFGELSGGKWMAL